MQPIAAVGDVGDAEALAGGDEVVDARGSTAPSGIWNGYDAMSR
jgi:hypothetical protein